MNDDIAGQVRQGAPGLYTDGRSSWNGSLDRWAGHFPLPPCVRSRVEVAEGLPLFVSRRSFLESVPGDPSGGISNADDLLLCTIITLILPFT